MATPNARREGAPTETAASAATVPPERAELTEAQRLRAELDAAQGKLAEAQRLRAELDAAQGQLADAQRLRAELDAAQGKLAETLHLQAELQDAERRLGVAESRAQHLAFQLETVVAARELEETRRKEVEGDLDMVRKQLRELQDQHKDVAEPAARVARPGYVLVRAKLPLVVNDGGGRFRPRQVAVGEALEVTDAEWKRDQALRFPHLEPEETFLGRKRAERQQQQQAVSGEMNNVVAGFELATQMESIRRQQQAVTAQQIADAQRLGVPAGPLPRS